MISYGIAELCANSTVVARSASYQPRLQEQIMEKHKSWLAIAFFVAFLTGCGGGGEGESSGPSNGQDTSTGSDPAPDPTPSPSPSPAPGSGRSPSPSPSPVPSPDPDVGAPTPILDPDPTPTPDNPAAFAAQVTEAPADGATVDGIVRLEIEGSNIQNAELLPATGYEPTYGQFTIAPDGNSAILNFNTTTLPDGPIKVRISAFNRPAGDSGASEIIAMPARTWDIQNNTSPDLGPIPDPLPPPPPEPIDPGPAPGTTPITGTEHRLYGGRDHNVFLGCLNCNSLNETSVCNAFGTYGNRFNLNSIWNSFGSYGSTIQPTSPWNNMATSPPVIRGTDGRSYGEFTVNDFRFSRTSIPEYEAVLNFFTQTKDLEATRRFMCN
jgi:hypothetical protein